MHFAPAQWVIQLVALLPVALRPGVLFALVFTMAWLVFVRPGLPTLLRRACRVMAVGVNLIVGLLLLPEYLLTRTRREKGSGPGTIALAIVPVVEHIQRSTTSVYDRCAPKAARAEPAASGQDGSDDPAAKPATTTGSAATTARSSATRLRLFPWALFAVIVVIFTAAVIAMEQLSRTAQVKVELAQAFEYWREVEDWGDVDLSRRATPADPALPVLVSATYHQRLARMSVACPGGRACAGTLSIRARFGTRVATGAISLDAGTRTVIAMPLPRLSGRVLHALHLDITQS
jgi:hypothetical protein